MKGQVNIGRWDETASASMVHVWFTDCGSLLSHPVSPNGKQVDDKRLAIDLTALKQLMWDHCNDCDGDVDGLQGDYLRGIDTSTMLGDCLTDATSSVRLANTPGTGLFDITSEEGKYRDQGQTPKVEITEERCEKY